jgi:intracellular sulfur oxidation DsrE/DsrF family protein
MPDKTSHIHHILINFGLSQKAAVLVIYGITIVLCGIALVVFGASGNLLIYGVSIVICGIALVLFGASRRRS